VGTLLFGSTLSIGNAGKIELGLSSSSSSDPSFNWWANDALTYLTIPGNYDSTWSTIGTGYDALDVAGTLTLGASTLIDASAIAGTYNTGDIFKLLDWSGVGTVNSLSNGSTSFFNTANLVLPTLSSGQTWDTSAFTTFGVVVVVPEPSRALLGLTALVVLGLRRRRSV
jgi:MYXO-CTERM domain-containing protein